ncbi:MAG: GNAT family N-acetyltransferase [Euryarchaeota archaeon]|jgi:aminoglycoside 6'-N-acetyltransferase I|nr:GNAT family N-acetyltransferase [Euryarchaeota archaeon]HHT18561.1 GNAT family N-acetyltransferase [Methanobacterium sp.]
MNSNYFTESVRKLRTDEKIPYDLLLLADETIEAIDKCIEDSEIYILEKQQKILGVYVLQFIDKRSVEIKYIAVDEKFQGQGIGTFLLEDAILRAKKNGFENITIKTGDCGIKQLHLYQKVGFEIFDVEKNFFIDNFPEHIYEDGRLCKDRVILKKIIMNLKKENPN